MVTLSFTIKQLCGGLQGSIHAVPRAQLSQLKWLPQLKPNAVIAQVKAQSRQQKLNPTPPRAKLDHPDLRYHIVEHFGTVHVCGPIVQSINDQARKIAAVIEIQKDSAAYHLIIRHLGLQQAANLTDQQKIAVYDEYQRLRAVHLEASGNEYRFRVRVIDNAHRIKGINLFQIEGRLNIQGRISVTMKQSLRADPCPRCLAQGTQIGTPAGLIAVEDLQPGMLVWTLSREGKQVAQPILRMAALPVPQQHMMLHLIFTDGRELWVSPGHPTVDGRTVEELRAHSAYGSGNIEHIEVTRYNGRSTYDLLPGGETGFYWANGVPLASTLR